MRKNSQPRFSQMIEIAIEQERMKKIYLDQMAYSLQNEKCFSIFGDIVQKKNKAPQDIDIMKSFLGQLSYFRNLMPDMPTRLISKIVKGLTWHEYKMDEFICRPGHHQCANFYIIINGEVLWQPSHHKHAESDENYSKTLGFDTTFGGHHKPEYFAIAKQDTYILQLLHKDYSEMLHQYHEQQLQQKLEQIQRNSVFSQVSPYKIKHKLHCFKEETFDRGKSIYSTEDLVTHCYVIIEGEVELSMQVKPKQLKYPAKAQLSLSTVGSIFGDYEILENIPNRITRAEAFSKVTLYKLAISEFQAITKGSTAPQLEHAKKKILYEDRVQMVTSQLIKNQSKDRRVLTEEEQIHEQFQSKVSIFRQPQNFIPSQKLIWNKKRSRNNSQELIQVKLDRDKEAQELLNANVKKLFNKDYVMRRILIQAYRSGHNLEVMNGLPLEKYAVQDFSQASKPYSRTNTKKSTRVHSQGSIKEKDLKILKSQRLSSTASVTRLDQPTIQSYCVKDNAFKRPRTAYDRDRNNTEQSKLHKTSRGYSSRQFFQDLFN